MERNLFLIGDQEVNGLREFEEGFAHTYVVGRVTAFSSLQGVRQSGTYLRDDVFRAFQLGKYHIGI